MDDDQSPHPDPLPQGGEGESRAAGDPRRSGGKMFGLDGVSPHRAVAVAPMVSVDGQSSKNRVFLFFLPVFDVWHVLNDVSHVVRGISHVVRDSFHVVRDTFRIVRDTFRIVRDTFHVVRDTFHVVRGSFHVVRDVFGNPVNPVSINQRAIQ
jgi:hypothetical protein